MTDRARALFDAHATGYDDELRRRLIPPYDAFYGTAVAALEEAGTVARVLDLGAGTGLLAAAVATSHPQAELVLVDGAPAMLERARRRLEGAARASFHVGDLRDPFPSGPFDAVVSALAIHHLDDAGKRALFARVHAALRPGGAFVNAEQVLGETPAQEADWLDWHRERSIAAGVGEAEWRAAEERLAADRCATVPDQLAWLRAAGFVSVTAPLHDHRFAVLVARKPA
jgi:tRNA (cmo5U34)-methyltransferase